MFFFTCRRYRGLWDEHDKKPTWARAGPVCRVAAPTGGPQGAAEARCAGQLMALTQVDALNELVLEPAQRELVHDVYNGQVSQGEVQYCTSDSHLQHDDNT